jgi:GTPase-associated system helical domain
MDQDNDTAAKRLNEIWREWGLEHGQEVKKAQKSALEELTAVLGGDDAWVAVRVVQALLANTEIPGVGNRPLFLSLWQAVEEAWDGAGSGRNDVLQLQAMLLAAWPEEDERAGKLATLLGSPWEVTTGREGQRRGIERWRQRVAQSQRREADAREQPGDVIHNKTWQKNIASLSRAAEVIQSTHAQAQQHTRDGYGHAQFAALMPQVLEQLGPTFAKTLPELLQALGSSVQSFLAHEESRRHTGQELLWWGQARYCHTLRKPFRRVINPQEQLWWAAWEAADRAEGVPVEPAAAYVQEVLHALGVPLDQTQPLRAWIEQSYELLRSSSVPIAPVGDSLSQLASDDALGLPVTWVRLHAGKGALDLDAARQNIALPLDAPVDHGQWAAWVFREILLDRFLAGEA